MISDSVYIHFSISRSFPGLVVADYLEDMLFRFSYDFVPSIQQLMPLFAVVLKPLNLLKIRASGKVVAKFIDVIKRENAIEKTELYFIISHLP